MSPPAQPALFLGHGNPLNALADNAWTAAWRELGRTLPKPKAILAISAHWYVEGVAVTAMPAPRTIHDFGGFPPELYGVRYGAPGSPALAARVRALLAPLAVKLDDSWGLDHGTWSLLCHMYPQADVPVVQLSIDARQPPQFHYEQGMLLRALRAEGVLVLGSGDVVHNLRAYAWDGAQRQPYDWAERFEARVRAHLDAHEHAPLIDYPALGDEARQAVPTPEHYLPLLYVMGTSTTAEPVGYPVEGMDGGSVSMLGVRFG